jgi:hypothetical protein
MTALSNQLLKHELLGHVREHENEYVQQYVEALYDEHGELQRELESVSRYGYTDEARATVRRVRRAGIAVIIVLLAFALGQLTGR